MFWHLKRRDIKFEQKNAANIEVILIFSALIFKYRDNILHVFP